MTPKQLIEKYERLKAQIAQHSRALAIFDKARIMARTVAGKDGINFEQKFHAANLKVLQASMKDIETMVNTELIIERVGSPDPPVIKKPVPTIPKPRRIDLAVASTTPEMLTTIEAAKFLGLINPRILYRMRSKKHKHLIPSPKYTLINRTALYAKDDLIIWKNRYCKSQRARARMEKWLNAPIVEVPTNPVKDAIYNSGQIWQDAIMEFFKGHPNENIFTKVVWDHLVANGFPALPYRKRHHFYQKLHELSSHPKLLLERVAIGAYRLR